MYKKPIWKFSSLLTLFAIIFIIYTYFVINGDLLSLDQLLMNKIETIEIVTQVMKVFHFIGSTIPVIFISGILLIVIYILFHRRQEVFLFLIVMIGSTALNVLTKYLIQRDRPVSELIVETGYSYPSGHAMAAFSLYGIITFLFWKHIQTSSGRTAIILFSTVMILTMGFSRIYLSVHYPSDVLGGFFLSGIWLYATIWVFQFIMDKKSF